MADLPFTPAAPGLAERLFASLDGRGRSRAPSKPSGRSPIATSSSSTTDVRSRAADARRARWPRVRTVPAHRPRGPPSTCRTARPTSSSGCGRPSERPTPGRLAEVDRVLRPDGRLLVVQDYGRDDVCRLRGELPEYGAWSRRDGPYLASRVPDPGHPLLLDVRLARRGPVVPRRRLRSDRRGGRSRPPAAAPQLQRGDLPPPARRRPSGILTGRRWYPPPDDCDTPAARDVVRRSPSAPPQWTPTLCVPAGPDRTSRRTRAAAPAEADAAPGRCSAIALVGALAVVAYGLVARDATQIPMLTAGEFMTRHRLRPARAGRRLGGVQPGARRRERTGARSTRCSAASRRSSRRAPSPRHHPGADPEPVAGPVGRRGAFPGPARSVPPGRRGACPTVARVQPGIIPRAWLGVIARAWPVADVEGPSARLRRRPPPSSRGLGRHPFKVEIRGSNPLGGTSHDPRGDPPSVAARLVTHRPAAVRVRPLLRGTGSRRLNARVLPGAHQAGTRHRSWASDRPFTPSPGQNHGQALTRGAPDNRLPQLG